MDINELLKKAVSQTASDVHIKVGSPPIIRVTGELIPMSDEERISQQDAMKIAFPVMSPGQREIFKQKNEIDPA